MGTNLMRHVVMAVMCCACGLARGEEGAKIDSAWLTKAKTEAKSAYEKYSTLFPRLEAECEYRYEKAPGPAGKIPFRAHIRRDRVIRLDDNMILEQMRILDTNPKQPQISLQCDNNDYHFTLSKSREDASYALGEYSLGRRKDPLIQLWPGLYIEVFLYLREVLAAIEGDGIHTLHELRFDDARGLLLAEYTYSAGDTPAQSTIYIDPSHDWRVVERRVDTSSLGVTERWSYGVMVGGLEFPNEYKNLTTYKVVDAPPNLEITGRLLSLKITDKKPEDFRLSAFGLPEPIDAPPLPKPTRWYLWIMAASGACAVIAIGFAYLRRRSQRTSA